MENQISKRISQYQSISVQIRKYERGDSKVDLKGNYYQFHRPWVAPHNWSILIFERAQIEWFDEFFVKTDKRIPNFYMDFLKVMNGAFIHDLNLFGIDENILSTGVLNRSTVQPLDLIRANISWINDFNVEKSFFYFGGLDEIGYFVDGTNQIFSMTRDGQVLKYWEDFENFLNDEIEKSEQIMLLDSPNDDS